MENEAGAPSGSKPATGDQTLQTENVEAQKQPDVAIAKNQEKNKDSDSRSKAWEHFEKIYDEQGKLVKARCIYCAKKLEADPKKNGTSSIRRHVLICMKNPNPKETRQTLLTLQPDVHCSDPVGVLGTWKFDNEAIRNALSNMVIVDEVPFKFVEGEGFKHFMSVACPRFKIPSRWTVSRDCYNAYLNARLKLKSAFMNHCQSQRVSITTDTWTSIQRINYMCITAHYIDAEWKLQKK